MEGENDRVSVPEHPAVDGRITKRPQRAQRMLGRDMDPVENTVTTVRLREVFQDDQESATEPLTRFRAAALRRSVLFAWMIVVVIVAQAVSSNAIADRRLILIAGVFVVVLAGATSANWTEVLAARRGSWAATVWVIFLVVAVGALTANKDLFEVSIPIYSGLAVLTGLILAPVRHGIVSLLSVILMSFGATQAARGPGDVVLPIITIGVVAAATSLIGTEFDREARLGERRLAELVRQQADFERLYAVSATLAGSESLAEGLPQIVGTICRFLAAQVGLVFLYHPEDHTLRVMSPVWVNGHTLEVDAIRMRVAEGGIVSQVFRSGRSILLDRIESNPESYGIIGELGVRQAMIAPLKVEGYNVGAIAVGDPIAGRFEEKQLEDLASLAAPAALVLSQLGRYESAAETTRQMQEVAQMKTDFVSVVSHELRTPLTSIIGSLATLGRPGLNEEIRDELLGSARRQADRLQRLIEDLLMISRIDRNSVPVKLEEVPVKGFLEEVAATVSGIKDLTINVQPADLVIYADPDHLGRVFINLVENAAKYALGSPVELVARAVRSRVDIDVIDHGDGIPLDQVSKVFEAFTQLERSDTRTKGGTGLGLSVVKSLVEAMNGQVTVSETPGGGATFTVSLPPATVAAREPIEPVGAQS